MLPPMYADPVPLANVPAVAEQTAAAAGAMPMASRSDHVHPRLTSATGPHTLNASGEAVIAFTQEFDAMPCVDCIYVEATDNSPVVFKVKSWTMNGAKYAGCTVKGYRSQVIPQNLVSLLVNAAFNVFGGSASGVVFTCLAVKNSG